MQEDLVFTELSRESKLIAFYNDVVPRDGHSFVAKMCFPNELADIPENKVAELRPDLRKASKGCKFCFHYGGQPITAATNLGIPIETAEKVYVNYFNSFPGIKAYFEKVQKEAKERGYILISELTGHKVFSYKWDEYLERSKEINKAFWEQRKRAIAENNEELKQELQRKLTWVSSYRGNIERAALNYPVQGTAALITKLAVVKLFEYLLNNNLLFTVKICTLVHDEILIECPISIQEQMKKVLVDCMEDAGSVFVTCVKLKAVAQSSDHWLH